MALATDVAQLQAQVASLLAEKGIPADPISAGLKNLTDHINARAAMAPQHDFSKVLARIAAMVEEGYVVTAVETEALRVAIRLLHVPAVDISYVHQLAEELHLAVLDSATAPENAE